MGLAPAMGLSRRKAKIEEPISSRSNSPLPNAKNAGDKGSCLCHADVDGVGLGTRWLSPEQVMAVRAKQGEALRLGLSGYRQGIPRLSARRRSITMDAQCRCSHPMPLFQLLSKQDRFSISIFATAMSRRAHQKRGFCVSWQQRSGSLYLYATAISLQSLATSSSAARAKWRNL